MPDSARRRLSVEDILVAAIGLVDADGAAELTMRRLGRALGTEAMAIYHYFPSRNDLVDAMVERAVSEVAADPAAQLRSGDDWRDYLDRLAHGVRRMALTHPRLFPLVATHPTRAPWIRPPLRSLPWVESFLSGLQDHHFPPPAAVEVYKQFCTFLLGHLLLEVAALGLDHPATASAPPAAGRDADRSVAKQVRTRDARHAEAVTTDAAPSAAEIEQSSQTGRPSLSDEPSVQLADPAAAVAAGSQPATAVDADVPVLAAVVSTASVDLSEFPHIEAAAGLLARDSAAADFDRHLGWLLDELGSLRRP